MADAGDFTAKRTRKPKGKLDSRVFMDGKIYLFRRADYIKGTWSCRVKTPGVKGYTTKSTGTTNEHEAYSFAERLYHQNLGKAVAGHDIRSKYAKDLLKEYVEFTKVHDAEGPSRKSKLSYLIRWQQFFGITRIRDVDTAKINELIIWTGGSSDKGLLAQSTINRFNKYLKQFFKWCEQTGHLEKIPVFPKTSAKSERRPHIDDGDYRKFTRAMQEFVKVKSPRVKRDRTMLVNYALILANTGIRVGEARDLKWRDIRRVNQSEGEPAICFHVRGKTGARDVVARTSDVRKYLGRIAELRKEETGSYPDGDSLVFCHPRDQGRVVQEGFHGIAAIGENRVRQPWQSAHHLFVTAHICDLPTPGRHAPPSIGSEHGH